MAEKNGVREYPCWRYRLEDNKVVSQLFQPDEEIPNGWKDEPPKPRGRPKVEADSEPEAKAEDE